MFNLSIHLSKVICVPLYRYEGLKETLCVASSLDPRFKTLPFLSDEAREAVFLKLTSEAAHQNPSSDVSLQINIGCSFEYLDYFFYFIEMQKNEFKLICVLFSCLIFFCIRTLHQSKRTLMIQPTWLHLHLDQLNPRGLKSLL